MSAKLVLFLGGNKYELNYEQELKCSEDTINDDLKNQPSYFCWYAVLEEMALALVNEAKLNLEIVEAKLYDKYRRELMSEPKRTEAMIENRIRLDPEYHEAIAYLNEQKKSAGILGAIREAFGQRKDILIALASNMRVQQDPAIYLKRKEFLEGG